MTSWQFPDAISLEVLGLFIARLEMMVIIVTNIMMLKKPSCKAQTAALFTNIINEVIFNINSSEPAFLKTL